MNKRELMAFLSDHDIPDTAQVMISTDAEGNGFSYVEEAEFYRPDELVAQDVHHPTVLIWPI